MTRRVVDESVDLATDPARNDRLRSAGVAGVIISSGLVSTGPDHHGPTCLYLMADGSVRWQKDFSALQE